MLVATLGATTALGYGLQPVHAQQYNTDTEQNSSVELPALDGTNNHRELPQQGASSTAYRRLGAANYADGVSSPAEGLNARYLSNRIFEDSAQNLFSEHGVTQWAYVWGQFIDHTIGLRAEGEEPLDTVFDPEDPLEFFANGDGTLRALRSAAAEGTGTDNPREQLNTISSYIDAWAVYGGTEERLEWLREGPVDGDLSNNGAKLLLTADDYLPRANERGDPANSPIMERQGQLLGAADADERQIVAGDVRANENIALTAVQTLFAREHNRLVDLLPAHWSEQKKFDAARLLVIATQQYITYEEFLPALGISIDKEKGYRPEVDASVTNEFATVAYRAHSMIHGEIEMETEASRYDAATIDLLRARGIEIESVADELEIAVPLNVAFAHPQLVTLLGLDPILQGLGGEPQYRNDEQIDNQLRSVLFQMPSEHVEDPDECLDGPRLNECFVLVGDIGTLDIIRGRDHGMPTYSAMRALYDLEPIESFAELTGESSDAFPVDDPLVDAGAPLDDPDILDYVALADADGQPIELDSEAAESDAVTGVRRTTLAARLKGIYGDVEQVDAFVGMVSEPHVSGSDLGELQYEMWKAQFEALRDGDRFHYRWSRPLRALERELALEFSRDPGSLGRRSTTGNRGADGSVSVRDLFDWRRTLGELIVDNTDLDADAVADNVFVIDR